MTQEEKPRGAGGKFISESEASNITKEDLPNLISKSSKMTGALKDIKEAKEEEELEKPLISVDINNPFTWFMKVINNLKKKQTTTFTFRLGIPIIALPIFIAAFAGLFFGLGKITSKEGLDSYPISRAGLLKIVSANEIDTMYLVLPSGEAIKLQVPENLDFSTLNGKRILVSGIYIQKDSIIKVDNVADMELLPESPKPIPTPKETPTFTSSPIQSFNPSSVSLPQKEDILINFFELINDGNISDAVATLSEKLIDDDSKKQAWGVQFNAFKKIEVKSVEKTENDNTYKVTLNIQMKQESENTSPVPYFGYGDGEFVRWINLEKENSLWKITGIATSP